jgi:hypothetical protein
LSLPFGEFIHSWSSPSIHFHQTFFIEPNETSLEVKSPFLVGCNCFANLGLTSASDLPFGRFIFIDLKDKIFSSKKS